MHDLIVRGGTVVTASRNEPLDVAVDGERVVALAPSGSLSQARTVIDASGKLVLPGGVDPHVHYSLGFGDVRAEAQDYSIAAAHGGTTTVIDFALQQGSTSLPEAVAVKRAEADGRMAVDYGLHAIVGGPDVAFETIEQIGDVIRAGVPTIKTFMTYGWNVDDGARWGIMREVADHGGMSVVHAEDDAIATWLTKKYVREGKTHGAYIAEVRGSLVEEAAIRRAMLLAERAGSPLYVLHMAAAAGVAALAEGRARGLPFYAETLTPYLSFSAEQLWDEDDGLLHNNYPTPKAREDRDELWRALAERRVQVVASDHFATSKADHTERMGTTVDAMMAGHPNVELRLPVLFSEGVQRGRFDVQRFVELVAADPARLMGLYPTKGTIEVGSDADIVVLDPAHTWTVHHEELHMSSDYSCWDGWELQGKVVVTTLRGRVLIDGGHEVGPRDAGRFLTRSLSDEVRSGDAVVRLPSGEAALGSGSPG